MKNDLHDPTSTYENNLITKQSNVILFCDYKMQLKTMSATYLYTQVALKRTYLRLSNSTKTL